MRHAPPATGDTALAGEQAARRRAMAAFALADAARLKECWAALGTNEAAEPLRGPEAGLVMLRGRVGGGGAPFNVGEASVTRASVRLAGGETGHAMILGRDLEKARLAAQLDAAWQRPGLRDVIEATVVEPALAARAADDLRRHEETEATRVDFFTMVRGDD